MRLRIKAMLAATILATLCSCGPEVVPSSGPRPATMPASVKIYAKKPARYEDLGPVTLEITPGLGWDKHGEANAAFDLLKGKAAALGANGLLLDIDPGKNGMYTVAGYDGTYYQVATKGKTAMVEAIYVLQE